MLHFGSIVLFAWCLILHWDGLYFFLLFFFLFFVLRIALSDWCVVVLFFFFPPHFSNCSFFLFFSGCINLSSCHNSKKCHEFACFLFHSLCCSLYFQSFIYVSLSNWFVFFFFSFSLFQFNKQNKQINKQILTGTFEFEPLSYFVVFEIPTFILFSVLVYMIYSFKRLVYKKGFFPGKLYNFWNITNSFLQISSFFFSKLYSSRGPYSNFNHWLDFCLEYVGSCHDCLFRSDSWFFFFFFF